MMTLGSSVPELPLQPAEALISAEASELQMSLGGVAANTDVKVIALAPTKHKVDKIVVLIDCFIKLLCYGCLINHTCIVSFANHVGYEGGDNLGEGNNGETDEGVGDHVAGLLEFAWVACRGGIHDAAVNDEDSGDDASYADHPLEGVDDDLVWCGALTGDTVCTEIDSESDADRGEDNIGRHDDGEAHEGLVEGLFAGGDFARLSAREGVLVTAINDVT